MILLDGIKSSKIVQRRVKKLIKRKINLAIILVGNNESSLIYVKAKMKKCDEVGIDALVYQFDENTTEEHLISVISQLNDIVWVDGILVQLPLPKHINERKVLDTVDVNKDVDGLNSENLTKIYLNREDIVPCTPKGIFTLLGIYKIKLSGKNVVIIGYNDYVGKPLASMCLNRGATVTVCHKKTKNLKEHTRKADIIMTATGVPKLIKRDMVKKGVVIIDIGNTRVKGKIVGDVDFENVKDKCSYITPVPNGVGKMTVISLVENLCVCMTR